MTAAQHLVEWVKTRLDNTFELEVNTLRKGDEHVVFLHLLTMIDNARFEQALLQEPQKLPVDQWVDYFTSLPHRMIRSQEDMLVAILEGQVALITSGGKMMSFDFRKYEGGEPRAPQAEVTILGGQNALTEKLLTNLNMVRQHYRSSSFRVEIERVGTASQTMLAYLYDEDSYDAEVLRDIKKDIARIDLRVILSNGQIAQHMHKNRWSLFPTVLLTERPDRVVRDVKEGRIAVMIEGAPFALVAPTNFYDFLHSIEDNFQLPIVGNFLLLVRYIGVIITTILPGAYVAISAYNPEILRVQLALSLAGSRSGVPYPSFLEVLFMLFMMELLTEASIRLPRAIGPTATTVGGLILGQAASEARLVSTAMIIVVAAVAISNYVIPIHTMANAIRVIKYPLILAACLMGMPGLMLGMLLLLLVLAGTESYGYPYLRPMGQRENQMTALWVGPSKAKQTAEDDEQVQR
jgi:spore germination protein